VILWAGAAGEDGAIFLLTLLGLGLLPGFGVGLGG